jgi:hypothetical protein
VPAHWFANVIEVAGMGHGAVDEGRPESGRAISVAQNSREAILLVILREYCDRCLGRRLFGTG